MPAPPPPRRPPPSFTPRFTLSLIYLFGFFFLYCMLLVAPALFEVARTVPPGPEQQAAAEATAKEAVQPRLYFAFAAAVATVALGAWKKWLPGFRGPH